MGTSEIDTLLVKMISNVSLFRRLEREDIVDLLRGAKKAVFKPGEVVFEEGYEGHSLYVIVSGDFEVYRHTPAGKVVLATIEPGEYFGEIALITSRLRTASVRSLDVGVALRFTKQSIFARPHVATHLLRNMAEMLAERLVEADEEIILHKCGRRGSTRRHEAAASPSPPVVMTRRSGS